MTVGIIGSGAVGRALGKGFAARGHDVTLGTRSPDRPELQAWARETGASLGSFADAAEAGELLVFAVEWSGARNAATLAGPERTAGKVVLDTTNPLDFSTGAPQLVALEAGSAGATVQAWFPEARVVKAFYNVGADLMVVPSLPGAPPTMFIAGDDAEAKETAAEHIARFGWEAVDLGGIDQSRYLEPLAVVWILEAMRTGSRDFALTVLRR